MNGNQAKCRQRRGSLWIVALLLSLSAAIRLVDGVGSASARSSAQPAQTTSATSETDPAHAYCSQEIDFSAVLASIEKRQEQLDTDEKALAMRMQTMRVAERQFEENLQTLIEAENELESTIAKVEGAAESDVALLAKVYQKMDPKEAAALFEAMDPRFSTGFLTRMPAESVAEIMGSLDPTTAYTLSVIMAGKNTEALQAVN